MFVLSKNNIELLQYGLVF